MKAEFLLDKKEIKKDYISLVSMKVLGYEHAYHKSTKQFRGDSSYRR